MQEGRGHRGRTTTLIIMTVALGLIILGSQYLWFERARESLRADAANILTCTGVGDPVVPVSLQKHPVAKAIEERNPTIVGFYTTIDNPIFSPSVSAEDNKKYQEEIGAHDFIESIAPPTSLHGVAKPFYDGDMIELRINENEYYIDGALNVLTAERLLFPTRDEFIASAENAFEKYKPYIFACADTSSFGFPTFREGISPTYVRWSPTDNIALVYYAGQKEVRDERGEVQIVDVSIILDHVATPIAINVGSHYSVLTR